MNIGTFAGNVGRADLRSTPSGQMVLNFSVAVRTGWGDKEKTLWVACALWGERAEKLAPYVVKGTRLTVSGDVDVRQYEAKDGMRAELTCNVQRLTLQSSPSESSARQAETKPNAPVAGAPAPVTEDEFSDDIPF